MELAHTDSAFSRCPRAARHRPSARIWCPALLWLLAALAGWLCTEFANAAEIASPIQVIYQFIDDSSGTHPGPTSTIILGFSPGNEAYLYAMSAKHSTAYHGQWSYANGEMSLKFTAADFSIDAHFTLNLAEPQVTMPFQVLSSGPGRSHWRMNGVGIENGIFAVYGAARADDALGISAAEAVKRAFAYGQFWQQAQAARSTAAASRPEAGTLLSWGTALYDAVIPVASADAAPCHGSPGQTKDEVSAVVQRGADMILVMYCTGPWEWIYLGEATPPVAGPALTTATLANDPRVHLDPPNPGDPTNDPPEKTALIIAPFTSPAEGPASDGYQDARIGTEPVIAAADIDAEVKQLKDLRYGSVTTLVNQGATVRAIVASLSNMQNPGILDWEGHGYGADWLVPYDHSDPIVGTAPGPFLEIHPQLTSWFQAFLQQLVSSGLGDLVNYRLSSDSEPLSNTIQLIVEPVPGTVFKVRGYIGITPKFWQWMVEKRGLNLHRSLAVMNTCDSANTLDLARALQARAFFGWDHDVSVDLGLAFLQDLLGSLARPTHSAEEAYYNMVRVAKTRAMINVEDRFLNGKVGMPAPPEARELSDLTSRLKGYGWDGSNLIDYSQAGWAGKASGMNAGQVWWLLFAERWSQNPHIGADNIANCYNAVWSGGDLGNGFKYMFCHNANTGQVPTRDEVAYAVYLLIGQNLLGFSHTLVPRWTLNDAR